MKTELEEAARKKSPFSPDGLGLPDVQSFGYGQLNEKGENDAGMYSAGSLRRIGLQAARVHTRPWIHSRPCQPLRRATSMTRHGEAL